VQPESFYNKKSNQETPEDHHLLRAHRRSVFIYRDGAVHIRYSDYLLFGFYNGYGKYFNFN